MNPDGTGDGLYGDSAGEPLAVAAGGPVPHAGAPATRSGRWAAYGVLAFSACLWGSGFLFGKIALRELSVGHMLLYRFGFGSVGLLPFVAWRRERVPRAHVPLFLIAAVAGVPIQYIVQFEGLARTTVAHASLMIGTVPVLLALAAVLFAGERLDAGGWVLLGISTLGALLIAAGARSGNAAAGQATLGGDALVLLSVTAGVAWVLLSKRLMGAHGHSAFVVNAYVVILGTVFMASWVLATQGAPPVRLSPATWLCLVTPGLLITALGSLLWNWGLTRVPATEAGAFVNIDPVVGTILGVLVLHESLGATAILGGVLIIGAALRFTLRSPVPPMPAPPD